MKLTVLLHRQTKEEPGYGTFRAYVVMGSTRGTNLLGNRQITNVESARRAAERELGFKVRLGVEIEWKEA